MQLNGSAFGSGIYLHNNAPYSINYSTGRGSREKFNILGVCLVKNPSKYDKKNGIYVVPDEENILLKYIYVLSDNNNGVYGKYLNDYYKNIKKEQQSILLDLVPIIRKRLNREKIKCKKSKKYTLEEEIVIQNGNYICEWIVSIDKKINNKNNKIKISINFSKEFPTKPPVIFVKSHRVKDKNILNGGGFAIPELSSKNWKPAKSKIYKILNKIYDIISNESCCIDENSDNYTINDAINGYYEYEKLL